MINVPDNEYILDSYNRENERFERRYWRREIEEEIEFDRTKLPFYLDLGKENDE